MTAQLTQSRMNACSFSLQNIKGSRRLKSTWRRAAVAFVALGCFLAPSSAQLVTPRSAFGFNVDYSTFQYNDAEGYVEIDVAVHPSLLTLTPDSIGYRGGVHLQGEVVDRRTDSVMMRKNVFIPVHVSDTTGAVLRNSIVAKIPLALPMGQYTLALRGEDVLDPSRRDSGKADLAVRSFSGSPSVSDVDLCSDIRSSEKSDDPFYKNSYEVVPNPSLLFGSMNGPVVFSYAEIYNLELDREYKVVARIVDGTGRISKEVARRRRFSVRNAVDVGTMNVTQVPSGKYRFVLSIEDTTGTNLTRTDKPIFIYNPKIAQTGTMTTSARSAELAGMTKDELAEEFRRAQYIATSEEKKLFGNLTTEDARREFLAKFWTDVEGGPRGESGLTRGLYLSRVSTANQRFRSMGKEGWQSDRGRVFILYGEPDETQRVPSSGESKPYEIWNYYHIENGVMFVFVDRSGFGDYALVHSTKRGEIQDDSWQRYLQ